ncbi:hypothetical protein C0J52_01229 [Blattella germanica]|nr:hypothetical protein C0J52_01229 [Blattella germanica]
MQQYSLKMSAKGLADMRPFSVEEHSVSSVWVHKYQHTVQTMYVYVEHFDKALRSRPTLLVWKKNTYATGSVLVARRSGQLSTRVEICVHSGITMRDR